LAPDYPKLTDVHFPQSPISVWITASGSVQTSVRSATSRASNDGRTLVAAAIAGHGIALQPRAVVADALTAGALVPILAGYTAPARPMYLLHSHSKPLQERLTALVDCIRTTFGAG
jgi:DNA-binding transcriptional LysR family regulator